MLGVATAGFPGAQHPTYPLRLIGGTCQVPARGIVRLLAAVVAVDAVVVVVVVVGFVGVVAVVVILLLLLLPSSQNDSRVSPAFRFPYEFLRYDTNVSLCSLFFAMACSIFGSIPCGVLGVLSGYCLSLICPFQTPVHDIS